MRKTIYIGHREKLQVQFSPPKQHNSFPLGQINETLRSHLLSTHWRFISCIGEYYN